jgi:hypothetical protein
MAITCPLTTGHRSPSHVSKRRALSALQHACPAHPKNRKQVLKQLLISPKSFKVSLFGVRFGAASPQVRQTPGRHRRIFRFLIVDFPVFDIRSPNSCPSMRNAMVLERL